MQKKQLKTEKLIHFLDLHYKFFRRKSMNEFFKNFQNQQKLLTPAQQRIVQDRDSPLFRDAIKFEEPEEDM
jgi:ABC-type long-subunit fatty acid transport system fused permease/ATPase subunit